MCILYVCIHTYVFYMFIEVALMMDVALLLSVQQVWVICVLICSFACMHVYMAWYGTTMSTFHYMYTWLRSVILKHSAVNTFVFQRIMYFIYVRGIEIHNAKLRG